MPRMPITTSRVKVSKIWSLCCRALGQVGDWSLLDPMSSQNGSSHRPVFIRPWQCQRRGGQVRFCAHPCPFSGPLGNSFQRCWMVKVKPNTPLQLVSTDVVTEKSWVSAQIPCPRDRTTSSVPRPPGLPIPTFSVYSCTRRSWVTGFPYS